MTVRGKDGNPRVAIDDSKMSVLDEKGSEVFSASQKAVEVTNTPLKSVGKNGGASVSLDAATGITVKSLGNKTSIHLHDSAVDVLDQSEAPRVQIAIPDAENWCDGTTSLLNTLASAGSSNVNADLDANGVVGTSDLLMLLAAWGPAAPGTPGAAADLNNDGVVDRCDEILLRSAIGQPVDVPATDTMCSSSALTAILGAIGTPSSMTAADVNGDGSVTTADLLLVLQHYGTTVTASTSGDANGDGHVDACDELIVSGNMAQGSSTPSPPPADAHVCSGANLLSTLAMAATPRDELCPQADVNNDDMGSVSDILQVLAAYGTSNGASDINNDGTVDECDLILATTCNGWVAESPPPAGFCPTSTMLAALASVGSATSVSASDLNGDSSVTTADLLILLGHFGPAPAGSAASASDINGDGAVDLCDETILRGNFGAPPPGGYCGASALLEALASAGSSSVNADINGDGSVGTADLLQLLGAWGPVTSDSPSPADLNGDGFVDRCDEVMLRGAWGTATASTEWCSTTDLLALLPNAASYLSASDIDGDGVVGTSDLLSLLASLGLSASYSTAASAADVTGDGVVNRCDELMLRHNFGSSVSSSSGRRLASAAAASALEAPARVMTVRGKDGNPRVALDEDTISMSDADGKESFHADNEKLEVRGNMGIKDTHGTVRFQATDAGDVVLRDATNRPSLALQGKSLEIYSENRTAVATTKDPEASNAQAGWDPDCSEKLPHLTEQIRLRNLTADFNYDGVIDGTDLSMLLSKWGPVDASSPYDFTGNSRVDRCDEVVVRALYGTPTAMPPTETWCGTAHLATVLSNVGTQSSIAAADVNQDGTVNTQDLLAILAAWGTTGPSAADVTGDGRVDRCDLVVFQAEWGQTSTSTGWCSTATLMQGLADYGTSAVDADVNADGLVNTADLLQLLADWGPVPAGESSPSDINQDGEVDLCDELLLRGAFGTVTTPQADSDWCSAASLTEILHDAQTKNSVRQADVNNDGVVTTMDLLALLGKYGEETTDRADVNGDGVVNRCDLVQVYSDFGLRVDESPESFTTNKNPIDSPGGRGGASPGGGSSSGGATSISG